MEVTVNADGVTRVREIYEVAAPVGGHAEAGGDADSLDSVGLYAAAQSFGNLHAFVDVGVGQ